MLFILTHAITLNRKMTWYRVKYIRDYVYAINNSWLHLDKNVPDTCINRIINYRTHVHGIINMCMYAHTGNLEALRYFYTTHKRAYGRSQLLNSAARNGQLHCVQWIFNTCLSEKSVDLWYSVFVIADAAKSGHLDCVKWLYTAFTDAASRGAMAPWSYIEPWVMDRAASSGDLQIMEYLHTVAKLPYTQSALNHAAYEGHTHVIKYLEDEQIYPDIDTLNNVASSGDVECMKYIYEKYPLLRCNTNAIICAINNDNLEMVQYLVQTGTQCNTNVIMCSINANNLEILKYLLPIVLVNEQHSRERELWVGYAIEKDRITLAQWIHSHCDESTTINVCVSHDALYSLGVRGNVNNVKWVLTIISVVDNSKLHAILRGAMNSRNYDLMRYVLTLLPTLEKSLTENQ